MRFLDETGLSYFWNKIKALLKTVAFTGSYSDLTDTPTNHVTTDTDQNISGTKTFVGQKKIKFKQSGSSDKLGFTLFTNNDVEKGYLEYNPTGINGIPLMTLGNYATTANGLTYVGFRRYSSISGAAGAYNLLTPLISDAKTPFNLTTTYTNFYLMLGATDGTTTVTVDNTGMLDLSSLLPTIPTNISSFTNDSGYLTSVSWNNLLDKPTLATVATTGSYNDLTDKPTISNYVLPPADTTSLGGVIVGSGLDINASGSLSVNGSYISSVASELISSGGYITTSEASTIISDQILSGGYVTSSGSVASAGVADGLTSTADSGYVHISGDEVISGEKTFLSGIVTSDTGIVVKNTNSDWDVSLTSRSARQTKNLICNFDKNNVYVGGIEQDLATNGTRRQYYLMKNRTNTAWIIDYELVEDSSGNLNAKINNTAIFGKGITVASNSVISGGLTVSGGGTYTGQLNCTNRTVSCCATSANAQVYVDNGMGHKIGLHTNTANNAGIYDWSKSKWIVYCQSDGTVGLNGNALTVNGTAGSSALSWNTEVTLYTVGGHAIKAKLPSNPNTNTTYSFATGDANGQIKVTPSGGSAQNVSVKGLGTAAYTASTAYAASNHNHDSVYLKLSGGTLTGTYYLKNSNLNIASWPGSGTTHLQYFGGVATDTNNVNIAAIGYRVDSAEAASRFYSRQPTDTATAISGLPYIELKYVKSGTYWAFSPKGNGTYYLGVSNAKWKQLYASTTTIATSDERFKTNITPISDEILDAWEDIQWKQFKFIDAIQEKGESNARFHNGLIAQQLDSIFQKHNLDITKYGLFCYDSWEAKEPTYITIEDKDENGNIIGSHQELENEGSEAGDSYALRYEEVLCMEAAYQRRRADRAEARITTLENRLNELEEALSSLISHGE